MRWINSAGGPLIVLDERKVDCWGGVVDKIVAPELSESWSPSGGPTDYDRACSVDNFLGRLDVCGVEALVLGADPMATTWLPANKDDGGMLVRWLYADSEGEVMRCLSEIGENSFHSDGLLSVEGTRLLLFDSGFAGRNLLKHPTEFLPIELASGVYDVSTAIHHPGDRLFVVVHRFRRRGG